MRVLFRVEWVGELPAEPGPGDRIPMPFVGELVVREVGWRWGEPLAEARKRAAFGPVEGGPATLPEGVDLFAELGPHLVEPGATWRANARLGAGSWKTTLDAPAATLGAALDSFADWAERWAHDEGLRTSREAGFKPGGHAELVCVEPSGSPYGRVVVAAKLGETEEALRALEAFCEEAERLYGDEAVNADENPAQRRGESRQK